MASVTQQPETAETSSTIYPDPRASLLDRLRCTLSNPEKFLEHLSSLKFNTREFLGPTEEEQAILYAAVRLLLGNTSNDPNNLKEKINNNELFRGEDDPVKAFQRKLIETVEALQKYCGTILKERPKDRPEHIFEVRKILIALQEYRNNHKDDQRFNLDNALSVTSSVLASQDNLNKVLGNPYCQINFQGQQQGA